MHMHWKRKTSNNFPHLEHWTRQKKAKYNVKLQEVFTRGHRNDPTRHSYATCMDFLTRFLDTFWSQIMPKSNYRIVGCIGFAYDIGKNRTQFIIFKFCFLTGMILQWFPSNTFYHLIIKCCDIMMIKGIIINLLATLNCNTQLYSLK